MTLQTLTEPAEYIAPRPRVFPSFAAWHWFTRRHRARLAAAGAVVKLNRRLLVDPERFDAEATAIGREAAQRHAAQSPGEPFADDRPGDFAPDRTKDPKSLAQDAPASGAAEAP